MSFSSQVMIGLDGKKSRAFRRLIGGRIFLGRPDDMFMGNARKFNDGYN